LRSLEVAEGMLAAGPIPQGAVIHPDFLISPTELALQGELGILIEVGFEAVAFPIDELSSVSYGIKPGDHVDVLMSFDFVELDQDSQIIEPLCPPVCPSGGEEEKDALSTQQRARLVSQLTVQDVKVLGVGRWEYAATVPTEEQEAEGEIPPPEPPRFITMMLTPQDALVLKAARELGADIDLAVRAQDDHQTFATQQVTLDYLMARFGIELPAKQPYGIGALGQESAPSEP
jgi:Flp pilus assembly protein CpaB